MESASGSSRARLRAAPALRAGLAAALAVTTAFPAAAADYDWSSPGKKETSAVVAALREPSTAALEALLYDGLEADQRLPRGRAMVPVLSLAVQEGDEKPVRLLLDRGADLDAMSTGIVEDSAAFTESLRKLSK